jgi:hypothetical protein
MATVYLLSAARERRLADPRAFLDLDALRERARCDRFGVHRTVDAPEDADIILFTEVSAHAGPYFERVRRHPVYRRFRSKCYMFSSTDRFVPWLPGVYASVEKSWYWSNWTRSGHYLGVYERGNLSHHPWTAPPNHLFSFVGAGTGHPVRRRILQLEHPEGLLVDTSVAVQPLPGPLEGAGPEPIPDERYVRSIRDSAFVLCPRGGGTASFRLFESMMLGRAPVIVSDQWVPPSGPAWDRFSVRVSESAVASIPDLLASLAPQAKAMGDAARAAWLDWFSETVSFHRIVEWCLELAAAEPYRRGIRRLAPGLQMMRPYHAARWAAWTVRGRARHGNRRV